MPKGFSGFPGNMQALMGQAQKMQRDLESAQKEAENFTADGSAGGGMVKASVSGKLLLTALTIEPEVVNPNDVEMLQDLILAAVNEALTNVQQNTRERLSKITGGMSIPGLF